MSFVHLRGYTCTYCTFMPWGQIGWNHLAADRQKWPSGIPVVSIVHRLSKCLNGAMATIQVIHFRIVIRLNAKTIKDIRRHWNRILSQFYIIRWFTQFGCTSASSQKFERLQVDEIYKLCPRICPTKPVFRDHLIRDIEWSIGILYPLFSSRGSKSNVWKKL